MRRNSSMSRELSLLKWLTAGALAVPLAKLVLDRRRPRAGVPNAPSGSGSRGPAERKPARSTHAAGARAEPSLDAAPSGSGADPQPSGNGHIELDEVTKQELYERARALDIHGRSKMNKEELAKAIVEHGDA